MRQRIRIGSRLFLLVLLLPVITGSAQDIQIRTRVDLVVVPVTVKTKADKLVTGLTKDDFTILEDGRKQTITNFTIDPVPLSAAVLIDTGVSESSLSKVQKTFPALAGAFSEFDEDGIPTQLMRPTPRHDQRGSKFSTTPSSQQHPILLSANETGGRSYS